MLIVGSWTLGTGADWRVTGVSAMVLAPMTATVPAVRYDLIETFMMGTFRSRWR